MLHHYQDVKTSSQTQMNHPPVSSSCLSPLPCHYSDEPPHRASQSIWHPALQVFSSPLESSIAISCLLGVPAHSPLSPCPELEPHTQLSSITVVIQQHHKEMTEVL